VNLPRDDGFRAPPAWAPHSRYWMAWPSPGGLWEDHLDEGRDFIAQLAAVLIEQHGPVTMLVNSAELAEVSLQVGPGVGNMLGPHHSCNLRNVGPTFLLRDDQLAAVTWPGAEEPGKSVLDHLGIPVYRAPLAMHGGLIEVDDRGTCLASETILAGGSSREEVETMLRDFLGVTDVIWLRTNVDGHLAGGQVVNVARFLKPGLVIAAAEPDESKPDHALLTENLRRLKGVRLGGDALTVVEVPLPKRRQRSDGSRVVMSYTNCFVDGASVILPAFEDYADQAAYDRVVAALLDHTVTTFPSFELAYGGAGLATIILPQPLASLQVA